LLEKWLDMSKKMCSLVKKDLPKDDPEKFKQFIKDPKFFCKKCGRVAAKDKNLCKAETL
jgi:hypothetical protein